MAHWLLEALDRPWLVMRLHGNLLQDGNMLLLFSYVTHLAPCNGIPCFSLVPVSKVLKECSISNSSGDVVVSGLEALVDGWELLSDDVSDKELSVPLVLVLSALELTDGELGKDTEDSLVVVSDRGCTLAG